VLALSFGNLQPQPDELIRRIEENIRGGEDIVLLPENCVGNRAMDPDDPFIGRMRALAARHRVYLTVPVRRRIDEKRAVVCAFLLDRNGEKALCYDKVFPFWDEYREYGSDLDTVPGNEALTADTDFGRVSLTICFDANFPELWQTIADRGAELVFFVSAYSAGTQLAAHALNHHYTIVACTRFPDFAVYDIGGRERQYQRADPEGFLVSRAVLDTDKVILHKDYNTEKVQKLLDENAGNIEIERDFEREKWIILRSLSPAVNTRDLCRDYGIEPLTDYQRRSRDFINAGRSTSRNASCNASRRDGAYG
jgi:predicted amidohydrolase